MEEKDTKEINLMQLINLFLNWLKNTTISLVKLSGKLLQISYKYKWMSLVVILIAVAIGQYMARPSARIYKAEAMGLLFGSEVQNIKEIFKQLENSDPKNNELSLASKLSIPDSVSNNIVGIETFYVIDYLNDGVGDLVDFNNSNSLKDTLNLRMTNRLYVRIKTMNVNQIPIVQTAIVQYFDSLPEIKQQFEAKQRNLMNRIEICNIELHRIDSMAEAEYFKNNLQQIKFDNNKLILGQQDKQLFYNHLLNLNSQKGEIENDLIQYTHAVTFPSGFVVTPAPLNGRLKYGVISIFFGYIISLMIIIIIDSRKKIIKFLENK